MPANPKYLTKSPWQRFAKISAGILGGYIMAIAIHLGIASWVGRVNVIITSTYSVFILWTILMILAFLAKNGWKIWGLYLLITIIFGVIVYLGKLTNPIIQ
ncbi:Ca2+/Na+ antiporter [Saonia flava]|uniref:Ca2+/Na+ antiporter n=1 Tax=Saonia flava TaxID=523696 RepID=A0A846QXL8_9FLAO|nr:hypothetical protein [Saonia flava]NJB72698.1 Ca2+/Na+ antiporter [Saonia flava]